MKDKETVLILTPAKDAENFVRRHFELLSQLTYPHDLISIAFLESDSSDDTYSLLEAKLQKAKEVFRSARLWKKDFGYKIPGGISRSRRRIQLQRRAILAKSRNYLLFRALDEEDWVLWLDIDVVEYPPDIIEKLLQTGKDIIQPNCVQSYGGKSFDLNAWRDKGKLHLHDLKGEGDIVRLHAVGGTMLLVRADIHREGLIFPTFLYGKKSRLIRRHNNLTRRTYALKKDVTGLLTGSPSLDILKKETAGELETEGLGIMAHDMGYECWGMPNLEIKHASS